MGGSYETIARIVCRAEQELQNPLAEARRNASDFFDLARKLSIQTLARKLSIQTNAKFAGGYLGDVRRGTMLPDIEEAVFSASRDDVVGPFSESGPWTLYKICAVHDPRPGAGLRDWVRDQMFNDWLYEGSTRYCHEGAKGIT